MGKHVQSEGNKSNSGIRAWLADTTAKAQTALRAVIAVMNSGASVIGAGAHCPAGVATNVVTTPMLTPKLSGRFRIVAFCYGHPSADGMTGMGGSIGVVVDGVTQALIPPTNYAGVTATGTVAATTCGYSITYDMTVSQALAIGTPIQFALGATATTQDFTPVLSYISANELP